MRSPKTVPLHQQSHVQQYAIDLSVGCMAVLAMTMADAWEAQDFTTLGRCAHHIRRVDNMTREEVTRAVAEGRLPDSDLTQKAFDDMLDHIARDALRGKEDEGA